ncbi:MAG: hypothetical protein SFX73_01995 [Kofleriaceae bacterium]|nr:hypothetical protein [Kofleriaceae bacterium]
MRISAVFTTMLLATTGLVSAEPVDRESTERFRLKDQPAVSRQEPDAEGWVELADPTPSNHGKEFIPVGANAGTFTRLRVDAHSGRFFLQSVRVDFKDGSRKVKRVDARLSRKGPKSKRSVVMDFGHGREIRQIVVTTDRDTRGTYTVHAAVENVDGVAAR